MSYGFFVQFHVTQRCNLRCRHCYQAGACTEMTGEEVRGAIDNVMGALRGWASDQGVEVSPSLHLTGGEPLLRRDIFDIVSYGREAGFSVSLMSNGTLIDAEYARLIAGAEVADVQVSLEGVQTTHDGVRGRGSYERAVAGIRELVEQGVEANINVTVSRLNYGETGPLISLAEGLGAGGIAFSRLVPAGRGRALVGQALAREELAAFYRDLRVRQGTSGVEVVSRDPLFAVLGYDGDVPQTDIPVAGCAAGMFGVTIGADGAIMPCRRMDLPVGNVKTDSFREVWASSPVLWALRSREDYQGACRECRYWAICRGCRAVVLAMSRHSGGDDYLGPDPQCPLLT